MKKIDIEETFLCLVAGLFMAVCFIAMLCGDGNKGLFELF